LKLPETTKLYFDSIMPFKKKFPQKWGFSFAIVLNETLSVIGIIVVITNHTLQ